jgi:hypothetical protein
LKEEFDVVKQKDNLGFKIVIYDVDHNPPHAHIVNYNGEKIAKFFLYNETPTNLQGIIQCLPKKDYEKIMTSDMKKKIFKWCIKGKNWNKLKLNWNKYNLYLTQLEAEADNESK